MALETAAAVSYEPYYEELRAGRLAFPRCERCGRFHWYPKAKCPYCESTDIEWTPVTGDAVIYTSTTVRYAFAPEFKDKLPYVVVFVEFDGAPGVRLVSNLLVEPGQTVHIGARVEPVFPIGDPTAKTVEFRLADR